jgi:hypothetical protein
LNGPLSTLLANPIHEMITGRADQRPGKLA